MTASLTDFNEYCTSHPAGLFTRIFRCHRFLFHSTKTANTFSIATSEISYPTRTHKLVIEDGSEDPEHDIHVFKAVERSSELLKALEDVDRAEDAGESSEEIIKYRKKAFALADDEAFNLTRELLIMCLETETLKKTLDALKLVRDKVGHEPESPATSNCKAC